MFWDDDDFILKNRYIKGFQFWPLWFSQNLVAGSYFVSNYWRPFLLFLFTIEWHLWKDWVYGWHAVSVLAHSGCGIMLYFLMNRLFDRRALALVIALLFVAHPCHNEAVVYVNSIGASLATLFVLTSLLCFTRFAQSQTPAPKSALFYLSILLYPLALLCKETGFVLVALIVTVDILLIQKHSSFWHRLGTSLKRTWVFIALAIAYVIARGTVLNFSNSFNFYNENNEFTTNIGLRLLTFFKAMTQYSGFLFFPYELRVERQMPWAHSLLEWDVLWGGLITATMVFCVFRFWRSRPWLSFGCVWFFMAIAPASNVLVPINATLYEHFLYCPMIGIMLIVTFGVSAFFAQKQMIQTAVKMLLIVLLIFAFINVRRNGDWRTAIGFYEKPVVYSPNYRVINTLGTEYADKGIQDKAQFWYRKAIAMDPNNAVAYHNLGGTLRDTGHIPEALAAFQTAIQLDHKFIFSYRALADLYWRLGQWDNCRRALEIIAQLDPSDENIRSALQEVRLKSGEK